MVSRGNVEICKTLVVFLGIIAYSVILLFFKTIISLRHFRYLPWCCYFLLKNNAISSLSVLVFIDFFCFNFLYIFFLLSLFTNWYFNSSTSLFFLILLNQPKQFSLNLSLVCLHLLFRVGFYKTPSVTHLFLIIFLLYAVLYCKQSFSVFLFDFWKLLFLMNKHCIETINKEEIEDK